MVDSIPQPTDADCHVQPLQPEHYCPECGAYNPEPFIGDACG